MKTLWVTLRRLARRTIVVFGIAAGGALLLMLGMLAYLRSAPGRSFLAAKLSGWVSRELTSELRIERIEVLANDRLAISGATLFDAKGRAVLRLHGLSARLDVFTLLRNAVFDSSPRLEFPQVHVERLEIGLFRADPGGVSLSHAFDTRPQTAASKTRSPTRAGVGLHVHLPKIAIDSVSARTDLDGLTRATAELRAVNASFAWSPELLSLEIGSEDARVLRALPVDMRASMQGRLRLPGATDVTLAGSVGALPVRATLRVTGEELALNLSSASLTPDAMRALVPAWPLAVPLRAQVELAGPVDALRARFQAEAGESRLDGSGLLALSPGIKGELSLAGRTLDARVLAPELARTALALDGKLEFAFAPESHFELSARVAEGELFGAQLPETKIVAVYARDRVSGSLASADVALPVNVDFDVSAQGALGFHARAQNLDLVALSRYGLGARGRADVDATGELTRGQLTLGFEARMRALQLAPASTQTASVRGKVNGSIDRLAQLGVEVQVQGTGLSLGAVVFPSWALDSKGVLGRQVVSIRAGSALEPTLQGSTTLAFEHGVSLDQTELDGDFNGVKHRLELKSAHIAGTAVDLSELHWRIGAGLVTGSVSITPARKQADLELSDLEAEAVSKTLGLDPNALHGKLAAVLHFEEHGRTRRAQMQCSLVDGSAAAVGAVQAEFSARLVDIEVEAQAAVHLPGLGRGNLWGHGVLGAGPITAQSLGETQGEVRLDADDVELAEVCRRWLPGAAVSLSGRADGTVRLSKLDARTPAILSYQLKTRNLGLHSALSGRDGSIRRAELVSHGEIGMTDTSLQLELKDAAGTWITLQAKQHLGWPELVRSIGSSSPELLLDAPLNAVIRARPRSLELLGAATPVALNGEFSANVSIEGSARRPEIEGSLNATGLGAAGPEPSGKLDLNFDYSAAREEYSFAARYAENRLAKVAFNGGGHWGWLEHGFGKDWSVRAAAELEQLELGPLAELLGAPISGQAAGHATVAASASAFEATADLDLARLALERHSLGEGRVQFGVHEGLAVAQLNLSGANGTLELSSEVGLCWSGSPCIDPSRSGRVHAKIRNYQLTALSPLLRSVASDVRGHVNGFASLDWDAADSTGKRQTRLRADASIAGGSVTLAEGAGSVQCAELRALGAGDGLLHVTVSGCVRANRPNLLANAEVRWDGPLPQSVDAELRITGVPVAYEGVVLGTATVDDKAPPVRVKLDLTGAQRTVELSIPTLVFDLPVKDDTRLVALEEDPSIRVVDVRAAPTSSADADTASPWLVSVRLGQAVSVRQPGMRVPVTGALTRMPDGLLVGKIVLPEGGVVSQLGQVFRLKRGFVQFERQAVKDGTLMIEAAARTADGVVIELYVGGTIEKPVVRLRSDPPRSESDIVALMLGVQSGDNGSSSGRQGQDLRGSATALAMNQLLRGSPLAGLQFGAGQTHSGDAISTVSMRASSSGTVWLEARSVRSTQRVGTAAVQSSGVVDWRFAEGFSLRTQLGNISGVEMRWSHRY